MLAIEKNKAVFLDRDGVLNNTIVIGGKPYPPHCLSEAKILDGVALATQVLIDNGFLLIVVTNQPDVARGTTSRETVEAINQFLQERLKIDEFVICYHDSSDECICRKPKPGGILEVAIRKSIDLSRSFMVGDRWRDIEAGRSAGLKTVFINYNYHEKQPDSFDQQASSLLEALPFILGEIV